MFSAVMTPPPSFCMAASKLKRGACGGLVKERGKDAAAEELRDGAEGVVAFHRLRGGEELVEQGAVELRGGDEVSEFLHG